jgi:hypothetical protein
VWDGRSGPVELFRTGILSALGQAAPAPRQSLSLAGSVQTERS